MNRYLPEMPQGSFLKWQLEKLTKGFSKKTPAEFRQEISAKKPDLNFIQNNRDETAVTWIGHSTILLQIDGLNILTDPQFSDRASPLSFLGPKRFVPLGVQYWFLKNVEGAILQGENQNIFDSAFRGKF